MAVPLVEIPRYVLLDQDPPGHEGTLRTFHRQSYELVDPVDFPRELFAAPLEEHARLLERHAAEILEAPYDHPEQKLAERFAAPDRLHWCTTILAADGPAHEVHKWETVDASYVVQAYRGILRRLTEVPPEGTHYVVILTPAAVSLQLVRVVEPSRVGDGARLEVAERDLVVEPREQSHLRDRYHVRTWWRTPAGDLVASRAPVRPWPRNAREKVEAILALREASVRARITAYREKNAKKAEASREAPLAVVDPGHGGEEIDVVPFSFKGIWLTGQPAIEDALKAPRPGLVPVLVRGRRWTALAWWPVDPLATVTVPKLLLEKETPQPDDGYEPPPPVKKEPAAPPGHVIPQGSMFRAEFWLADPPERPVGDLRVLVWAWVCSAAVCTLGMSLALWRFPELRAADGFGRAGVCVVVALATTGLALGVWRVHTAWRARDTARRESQRPQTQRVDGPAPDPDEQHRREWMRRLGRRLRRFERLVEIEAPQFLIDDGRRLVHAALAEIEEEDGEAVLADFPRARSLLATAEEKRAAAERAKAKSKAN